MIFSGMAYRHRAARTVSLQGAAAFETERTFPGTGDDSRLFVGITCARRCRDKTYDRGRDIAPAYGWDRIEKISPNFNGPGARGVPCTNTAGIKALMLTLWKSA